MYMHGQILDYNYSDMHAHTENYNIIVSGHNHNDP